MSSSATSEMIAYLLLTNISRMFSSMPGLAGGIAREIREGTMKRYLVQPIDMIGYLLVYRIAHKVTYIIMSFVPYALLFFLCRDFFDGFPDALTMGAFALSLVLSFLVGFFFELSVGMVGFWFLEVTSLLYIVMTLEFLYLGTHVAARLASRPVGLVLEALAVSVHGLFSGRRLPGQGPGAGRWSSTCWPSSSGRFSSWCWRGPFIGWDCGGIAPSEAETSDRLANARQVLADCSAAWGVSP